MDALPDEPKTPPGGQPPERPGGWEGQQIGSLGVPPTFEPDDAPPDVPPLPSVQEPADAPVERQRPGGKQRDREPFEVALPFVRAPITAGTWQRCSAWWERVNDENLEFGKGMDYGQRLSTYLNHATWEHAAADLEEVMCPHCGTQFGVRGEDARQYDWLEMHGVDLRQVLRLETRAISDEAARGQTATILRRLADAGASADVLQLIREMEDELR